MAYAWRRAETRAVTFRGTCLHLHHGHSTVAARQGCPSQCSLGCGMWGMQSVFVYSKFSFVFLMSSCRMSESVPDFLTGGNGMGKGIAAHIEQGEMAVNCKRVDSD